MVKLAYIESGVGGKKALERDRVSLIVVSKIIFQEANIEEMPVIKSG